MEWLRQLSDDQFALLGCLGAVIAGFGMLSISYYVSGARQRSTAAKSVVPARSAGRRAA